MIVALSQEVCQQVQEIGRLDRLKSSKDAIERTFEALSKAREDFIQLKALVVLLSDRLAEQYIQRAMKDMQALAQALQSSLSHLDREPNQVKDLRQLQTKAKELISALKKQWQFYADDATRESLELLQLVRNLPEVREQQERYQELEDRLRHYKINTPLTPEQLAEFDQSLLQLSQQLANINGLSSDVKRFLRNVLNNQATLADLTDEVLQWCRQGDHAQVFMIGFARYKKG